MAEKKRKLTEAERKVRRSQVGKQRRATHPGAHFAAGAGSAGHSPQGQRELISMLQDRNIRKADKSPRRLAREHAITQATLIQGGGRGTLSPAAYTEPPVQIRRETVKKVADADKEARWRHEPNVYSTQTPQTLSRFWKHTAAPSHKKEIDKMMADPHSAFNKNLRDPGQKTTKGKYNPGQRRRLEQYTNLIQQGYPHDVAVKRVSEARQGPQPGVIPQTASETRASVSRQAATRRASVPARSARYEQAKPKPHELSFGIGIGTAQKADDIRQALGRNITDQEIVMVQQAQNRQLLEEFQKNQLWAQETRRANILTGKSEGRPQDPDRVVFFTTSLGSPSASIPSDSLVGQYIIKRRKRTMKNMGFTEGQLKGKFPQAVRDIHVFEAATGIEAGVQGDYGLYQKTGYRKGTKTSRGYGKPVPIGSQIMYDSQGRPMYDQAGNIRFTEGATRRFRKASKPLSLGVFVG